MTLNAAPNATAVEQVFYGENGVAVVPSGSTTSVQAFGIAIDRLLAHGRGRAGRTAGPVRRPLRAHRRAGARGGRRRPAGEPHRHCVRLLVRICASTVMTMTNAASPSVNMTRRPYMVAFRVRVGCGSQTRKAGPQRCHPTGHKITPGDGNRVPACNPVPIARRSGAGKVF